MKVIDKSPSALSLVRKTPALIATAAMAIATPAIAAFAVGFEAVSLELPATNDLAYRHSETLVHSVPKSGGSSYFSKSNWDQTHQDNENFPPRLQRCSPGQLNLPSGIQCLAAGRQCVISVACSHSLAKSGTSKHDPRPGGTHRSPVLSLHHVSTIRTDRKRWTLPQRCSGDALPA